MIVSARLHNVNKVAIAFNFMWCKYIIIQTLKDFKMTEDKSNKTEGAGKADVEKNKSMAIVAWFIFFVPLLTDAKNSKFAKFHANQSLLVLVLYVAVYILATFLAFTPLYFVAWLLYFVPFVFWIMGIISAVNGEMKRLPVIGTIDIIK